MSEKKELNAKLKELDNVRKNEKAMAQKVSKAEAKVRVCVCVCVCVCVYTVAYFVFLQCVEHDSLQIICTCTPHVD